MPADTVTLDRAEFDAVITELGALGGFLDRVFGGNTLESPMWSQLHRVQRRLLGAAGLADDYYDDESKNYKIEDARELELVGEFADTLRPKAVTVDA